MKRRNFLAMLGSLPLLGFLKGESSPGVVEVYDGDVDLYDATKFNDDVFVKVKKDGPDTVVVFDVARLSADCRRLCERDGVDIGKYSLWLFRLGPKEQEIVNRGGTIYKGQQWMSKG